MWLTGGGGAAHRSAGSTTWQAFNPEQLPSNSLYRLLEGADGAVYAGSDNGVVRFTGDNFNVWAVANAPDLIGFSHILPHPDGENLWFVEEYGPNYDIFNLTTETWTKGPALACGACLPLAWDDQERLWAGGNNGAWIVTGQNQFQITADRGLPGSQVLAVAFDKNDEAWLGTDGGLAVYDGEKVSVVYTAANSGLAGDTIDVLLADSAGGMWVATDENLSYFNPAGEWQHFAEGDFGQAVQVVDLAEDSDGGISVATARSGLYRFFDGAWTHFGAGDAGVALPTDSMNAVYAAPDGKLWFGLNYGGAANFDGNDWNMFTVGDGLIHDNVNDIYAANSGDIYFATSGGVSRYQP